MHQKVKEKLDRISDPYLKMSIMSTRDMFAAHALQGMLASDPMLTMKNGIHTTAKAAFDIADAMMLEREP